MYSAIPKNEYHTKHRSDDIEYFHGGHIPYPSATEKSLDLPKSIYLTKGNPVEKKFSIRVDLHSKYIEIPLSMAQLKDWFAKIEEDDAVALEEEEKEAEQDRRDLEAEKNAAIDMGIYDIGQEKGMLNWMNDSQWAAQYDDAYSGWDDENCSLKCTLTPSTYDHSGECMPSKEKCQLCYKYWCGKCGNGLSNYLVKCCWK
jgi:hypothetical protein